MSQKYLSCPSCGKPLESKEDRKEAIDRALVEIESEAYKKNRDWERTVVGYCKEEGLEVTIKFRPSQTSKT